MPLIHNNPISVTKLNENIDTDLDLGSGHSLYCSNVHMYGSGNLYSGTDDGGIGLHGGASGSKAAKIVLTGKNNIGGSNVSVLVPDAAKTSDVDVISIIGNTNTPVIDVLNWRVQNVAEATTAKDALRYNAWTSWSPTISYSGTAWVTPSVYAFYARIGKTIFIQLTIASNDTNASTITSITVPVTPRSNGIINPLATFIQNTNAYTYAHEALAFIDQTGSVIQFQAFPVTVDGQLCRVMIQGFYEVS